MKKKIIRLTESDLHHIIESSLHRIIRESDEYMNIPNTYFNGDNSYDSDVYFEGYPVSLPIIHSIFEQDYEQSNGTGDIEDWIESQGLDYKIDVIKRARKETSRYYKDYKPLNFEEPVEAPF